MVRKVLIPVCIFAVIGYLSIVSAFTISLDVKLADKSKPLSLGRTKITTTKHRGVIDIGENPIARYGIPSDDGKHYYPLHLNFIVIDGEEGDEDKRTEAYCLKLHGMIFVIIIKKYYIKKLFLAYRFFSIRLKTHEINISNFICII